VNDRRHQRRAANSVSGAITDDQRGPIYDTTAFDILVGTKEKKKNNEKSKKFRSTGIRTRDNRSTTGRANHSRQRICDCDNWSEKDHQNSLNHMVLGGFMV